MHNILVHLGRLRQWGIEMEIANVQQNMTRFITLWLVRIILSSYEERNNLMKMNLILKTFQPHWIFWKGN